MEALQMEWQQSQYNCGLVEVGEFENTSYYLEPSDEGDDPEFPSLKALVADTKRQIRQVLRGQYRENGKPRGVLATIREDEQKHVAAALRSLGFKRVAKHKSAEHGKFVSVFFKAL
jgi:hypothetical protein